MFHLDGFAFIEIAIDGPSSVPHSSLQSHLGSPPGVLLVLEILERSHSLILVVVSWFMDKVLVMKGFLKWLIKNFSLL